MYQNETELGRRKTETLQMGARNFLKLLFFLSLLYFVCRLLYLSQKKYFLKNAVIQIYFVTLQAD